MLVEICTGKLGHYPDFASLHPGYTPSYNDALKHRSTPMSVAEQHTGKPAISLKDADFNWEDPLDLEGQLSEEERMVRDTARGYAQEKLFPRVLKAYREESFDRAIMSEMGALGLIGATVPEEYGGAGLGYVAYGLIAR